MGVTPHSSEHDEGDVEIVVYNRAILLFTTDSEAVRRTHQVCCRLDDLAPIKGRRLLVHGTRLRRGAHRGR